MTVDEDVLAVDDLVVEHGKVHAVRGVSFTVPPGGLVTLVGANGAGKSSIINAISGLVRPRSGTIRYCGKDITRTPSHRLVGRGLVQVPEGRQILASMTIDENLRLGGWHSGPGLIKEVYERFPVLAERRSLPAGSLSGGEQQMLAIGRAVVARPRLMLLDEPSMGLAPKVVDEVFAAIGRFIEAQIAVVLVEQYVERALAVADEVTIVRHGRVEWAGPAAAVDLETVAEGYLGAG